MIFRSRTTPIDHKTRAAIIADRAAGVSYDDIVEKYRVGRSTVFRIMASTKPKPKPKPARTTVKARRPQDVQDITRRPAENNNQRKAPVLPILATEGRWAALAEYAAANGLTTTQAQQRWHKARAAA